MQDLLCKTMCSNGFQDFESAPAPSCLSAFPLALPWDLTLDYLLSPLASTPSPALAFIPEGGFWMLNWISASGKSQHPLSYSNV